MSRRSSSARRCSAGTGLDASLSDPGALRSVVGAALYVTVAGMTALALGALLRNTAAAITTFVAVFFVIPPLTLLLPASLTDHFVQYLPSNLGGVLVDRHLRCGQLPGALDRIRRDVRLRGRPDRLRRLAAPPRRRLTRNAPSDHLPRSNEAGGQANVQDMFTVPSMGQTDRPGHPEYRCTAGVECTTGPARHRHRGQRRHAFVVIAMTDEIARSRPSRAGAAWDVVGGCPPLLVEPFESVQEEVERELELELVVAA